MKKILSIIVLFALISNYKSQQIYKLDIDNFWIAFDSIQKTNENKAFILKQLYIEKGSEGLKSFMKLKNFNENNYIESFKKYPKFWKSIRENTIITEQKSKTINNFLKRFSRIYPNDSNGFIFYTIGALKSGGTSDNKNLILGLELVTGNKNTDTSEFEDKSYKLLFNNASKNQLEHVTIHEFTHTFQKKGEVNVLSKAIKEGSCDFIAELVIKQKFSSDYMVFGYKNYEKIKSDFEKEMLTQNFEHWFFNRGKAVNPDLGYFVGYEISKKYYDNAKDKKQAVKEIIELDFSDENTVLNFLAKSKYLGENFNPEKIKSEFKNNQPKVVKILEFENGSQNVNPNLKKIQIIFSKPMNDKVSFNLSKNGNEHFPLKNIVGFNDEKTILTLETVDLKADTEYDFYVTNRLTKSLDGYPFIESEYKINFKTSK